MAGLGYDLVHVEQAPRSGLLRFYIDKPGGIGLDDCAFVSTHVTKWLAVEGVEYERLEVSSPGIDRPLSKLKDFLQFRSNRVKIRFRAPVGGRRNMVAVIAGVEGEDVLLEVDGNLVRVAFQDVEKARLVPDL